MADLLRGHKRNGSFVTLGGWEGRGRRVGEGRGWSVAATHTVLAEPLTRVRGRCWALQEF